MATTERVIDLDLVVSYLKRADIFAYVEQTGGGTATIYAGPTHMEDGYGKRFAAIAGPGWFEGPAWTGGRGYMDDFYVGPDTEDQDTYTTLDGVDPALAEVTAARLIIDVIERATT
jgi:hypothetical protein